MRHRARDNPPANGESVRLRFVHHSARSTTVVAAIPAGGGIRAHIHTEHDEVIKVVDGETDFRFGQTTSRVRAGQTISVPGWDLHEGVHE
jgi:quercetin dioxygenase-like cupin family protein